jgi:hypothetical protein
MRFQIGKPLWWRLEPRWSVLAFGTALDTSGHSFVDSRAIPGSAMGILAL